MLPTICHEDGLTSLCFSLPELGMIAWLTVYGKTGVYLMIETFNSEIVIEENSGFERNEEPVRVGLPVPLGAIEIGSSLAISTPNKSLCYCQIRPLKTWPDGSVKWLLVDFLASVPGHSRTIWKLVNASEDMVPANRVDILQLDDRWVVDTGVGQFHVDIRILKPFVKVLDSQGIPLSLESACKLSLDGKTDLRPRVDEISIEDSGPLRAIVLIVGHFEGSELRFQTRMHFIAGTLQVKFEMTLHNPQAATHPQGLWDLGDPGSIGFQGLEFGFVLPEESGREVCCYPEVNSEPISGRNVAELSIYQESSGGDNWQSPNHRNKNGRVSPTFRGYKVHEGDRFLTEGFRATPMVWSGKEQQGVAATIPFFWQEFPKQLKVAQNQLNVELFPAVFPDVYELQGGEQKTHSFYLDFSANSVGLRWSLNPLAVMASPNCCRVSGVFNDLPGEKDIVDQFVAADDYFNKREAIDEYGWRNFGDVYADHEAVLTTEKKLFISHYNNQYDLISGFYRKAFSTGDQKWKELASDLAGHVVDIDLYHTNLDRPEYNHGLFWHTDHYTDAGLSTHRSYSREQISKYGFHAGGGGPGKDHCYATGLALHYYLTADPKFKQAVIDLANWELISLSGPQTVFGALKRLGENLRFFQVNRKKKVVFPRYPLDRGTGNAITVCLDAYELTDEKKWLTQASNIIKGALHPKDDIFARSLENIEISWSYVVLLTSIGKYLDMKILYGERDVDFEYARRSLQTYAVWMADNEYPYLDKSEILEYPSETWAAQELRKSVVFYYAAKYADDEKYKDKFLEKGVYFHRAARKSLLDWDTSNFTRPVALMLQSCWIVEKLNSSISGLLFPRQGVELNAKATPFLSLISVSKRFLDELLYALSNSNLKQEVAWLSARLKGKWTSAGS